MGIGNTAKCQEKRSGEFHIRKNPDPFPAIWKGVQKREPHNYHYVR